MKKKFLSLMLCGLMGLSLFITGCGSSTNADNADNSGVIELTYWYTFKDKIGENNEALVKEFNESQDKIHVTAEYQGNYDEIKAKTKAAFTANEAPDVTITEIASVPEMVKSGIVEDLTPFIEKDNIDIDDFHEGLMKNSYIDDKLYALPYLRSTPILYMNATMLKEAGLDPSGPKNWQELEEYCRAVTKGDTIGMTYPVDTWFTEAFLAQMGGSVLKDDDTKSNVNTDEMIKGLEFLKKMNDEGIIKILNGTDEGNDKKKIDFKNQKCAMFFSSTADLTYNLQVAEESGFELNTAFMPAGNDFGVPTGGCNMYMVSGLSEEKKQAAWEFIKFMTSTERTAEASRNTGYLPTRKSSVDTDIIQNLYKEKPQFKVAVDQLQYAVGRPKTVHCAEVLKLLKESEERIFLQNADIKTELEKLDKDINDIMSK